MRKNKKENDFYKTKSQELEQLLVKAKKELTNQAEEILTLRFENIELNRELNGEGDFNSFS